ncbi:hypothetical protein HDV05_008663 [Chytridiales sp. JEL 0842]|nr:hypothetical protein HDV05_008663 [Chytridiales sp. JEL 0842]
MRQVLTGKFGNKNFYKGTGSGAMGRWTRKGAYILEPERFRQYMIPNLTGFQLTPYINPNVERTFQKSHSLRDYFWKENLPKELDNVTLIENMRKAAKEVSRMVKGAKKDREV